MSLRSAADTEERVAPAGCLAEAVVTDGDAGLGAPPGWAWGL